MHFVYTIPHTTPCLVGSLSPMNLTNRPVVQRSWGLNELSAQQANSTNKDASERLRYGKTFQYVETLVFPNKFSALMASTLLAVGGFLFVYVPPVSHLCWIHPLLLTYTCHLQVRWTAKKFLPKPGQGPSDE